jgi:hypothetical protein
LPQRREVLDDGQPMQLGGRAFDLLTVLLKAKGARQQRRTEEPGLAGPDRINAAMKAERSEASSNQMQRRIKVWANHNNKVGLPPKDPLIPAVQL